MRKLVLAGVSFALLGLAGCGGSKGIPVDPTVPVQGKVQLDGQPLAEGEILFGVDGKPPQIIPITNGVYAGNAMPGENRIELAVYKTETDSMTNQPMKINTLPPRFSHQSTLKAPVTESGPNNFDYEIQSR